MRCFLPFGIIFIEQIWLCLGYPYLSACNTSCPYVSPSKCFIHLLCCLEELLRCFSVLQLLECHLNPCGFQRKGIRWAHVSTREPAATSIIFVSISTGSLSWGNKWAKVPLLPGWPHLTPEQSLGIKFKLDFSPHSLLWSGNLGTEF